MYFVTAFWEGPDGKGFEHKEFSDKEDLELWLNEFLEPDYCGWNDPDSVDQETKVLIVIEGKELSIKPDKVVELWKVEAKNGN